MHHSAQLIISPLTSYPHGGAPEAPSNKVKLREGEQVLQGPTVGLAGLGLKPQVSHSHKYHSSCVPWYPLVSFFFSFFFFN
jgi:hypothetical protein